MNTENNNVKIENNNVKIEIVSGTFRTQSGTSKKSGNAYELRLQEGYLHNGHAYPDRFELSVPKDDKGQFLSPYAPGFYTLAPGAIQVNREFGRLELNPFEMRLVRLPDAELAKK